MPEEDNFQYSHWEALAFRQERDDIREEYAAVSKKFGIHQAEWEHQRKQFCDAISGQIESLFESGFNFVSFSFVLINLDFSCSPVCRE